MVRVTKTILRQIYKSRASKSHKYNFGLLLIIGGSKFYSGSPALAALAGFRSGVDMVYVVAPQRAADIVASFSPDLAAYPLKGDYLTKQHISTLVALTQKAEAASAGKIAVVIGGGLGRDKVVLNAVAKYISQVSIPKVIDADAIYALKKGEITPTNAIITPHSHEFFVLTGKKVSHLSVAAKAKLVSQQAKKLQATILLKGDIDIISNGEHTALNKTGNPYLTVGGTGDTLAGICGSLVAQGQNLFVAAQAAAYINGRAGDIAVQQFGPGFLATDLIEAIPEVISR